MRYTLNEIFVVMTHKDIITPITVVDYQELDPTDRTLVDTAREATLRAYALTAGSV